MKWDPKEQDWVEDYPAKEIVEKEFRDHRRKSRRNTAIIVGVALLLIGVGATLAAVGGGETSRPPLDRMDITAPTPSVQAYGFDRKTLKQIATRVAVTYYVAENAEASQEILNHAKGLAQPCILYMSSGYHKPGDFTSHKVRAEYRQAVKNAGATGVLVKVKGQYGALVQICPPGA